MRRSLVVFLILIAAGTIVRIGALTRPGTPDMRIWKAWAHGAADDLTGVYGVGGEPLEHRAFHWGGTIVTVDYPPIALYELAAAGHVFRTIERASNDSPALTALVKLPGFLAEVALLGVLLVWGRRQPASGATWAAMAWWLSPAIVLDGAVLGYLDAQMAVPAVLALLAAASGRPLAAGVLAAIAMLTKAQAVFVLPALAIAIASAGARRQAVRSLALAAAGGAATAVAALLPFVLRGAWPNLVQAIGRVATHDMLSGNAANAWWIVDWVLRVQDAGPRVIGWWNALAVENRILAISQFMALGYPNARAVGLVLVGAAFAWMFWMARRGVTLTTGAALAAWSVYAYALFAAQVHENHLYLALPFLAVAAAGARRLRPIFWTASVVLALNLYLFYGLGDDRPPAIDRAWTHIDLTVIVAIASVATFVWFTLRLRQVLSHHVGPWGAMEGRIR